MFIIGLNSHFGKGFVKAMADLLVFGTVKIGDGHKLDFGMSLGYTLNHLKSNFLIYII
jgi:hypothetical protein